MNANGLSDLNIIHVLRRDENVLLLVRLIRSIDLGAKKGVNLT